MMRILSFLALLIIVGIQGRGIRRFIGGSRIIDGENAKQGEFPSQVSLQSYGHHYCGASILNKDWALTAAHCISDIKLSDLSFLVGTISLVEGGTHHNVSKAIAHENYNLHTLQNDIAVVKVETPFEIDDVNVKPVNLPDQDFKPADKSIATVIGWGYIEEHSHSPDILQKVDVDIVNHDLCNSTYRPIVGFPIFDSQICAGINDTKQGPCNGDAGGPLFVNGTIVGTVSWGNGCAKPGYPVVYSSITAFLDWIMETIAN